MRYFNVAVVGGLCTVLAFVAAACDQSNPTPEAEKPVAAKPAVTKHETAPPPTPARHETKTGHAASLALTGIHFDVPEGWQETSPSPRPMGPKAVFILPKADGDEAECSVRITYFPGMKGKNDLNIDRWVSQVKHADGTPSSREDADIQVFELGGVRVTMVDISGVVNAGRGMGAVGTGKANQRMISAIVDHPKGPHFVKAVGGVASIKKWEPSIEAFLKSARVE